MSNWTATCLRGKIHVKHGFPFKSEFFSNEGPYILLTPGNFHESGGFKRQPGNEKFYIGPVPKDYIHKRGDLIVAMTEQAEGLLGSCAFVPEDDLYLHNQRLGLITTDQRQMDIHFVYYLFQTRNVREQLRLTSSGSKVKHTSPDRIYLVSALIPPVTEQKKIAAILSILDTKIELNNRINAELEALAKTLYDYWFVQFCFPDKNGKPYKSSGGKMVWSSELKRDIPEGWEVKCLSEITGVSTEQMNPLEMPDKDFKHYSIPAYDAIGSYMIEKGKQIQSNKFTIIKYDVLVSKLNPRFNRVVYARDESDTISSTEFVVWRSSDDSLKNYLYMIARDQPFITYCSLSATGTSNSHKRVNPDVMMKYKVPYNRDLSVLFGKIISPTIKKLSALIIENNELNNLRDWLLPMLMNGQLKVS